MTQPTIPMTEQEREVADLTALETARSAEACRARAEILEVGRKLWERGYVDGNGGNISVRVGQQYLLCTPTMISKRDMEPDDLCLADLNGTILVGDRPRTSELLLHLEIYKANPKARAVVHCHPPHATAWAVVGEAPPNGYVTEFELMVGPVAVAPYETPGTQAFAETVIPFVEEHNTILLANHGIVCWADSATHAEWLVEIVDTYCKTLGVAQQIGRPLKRIPEEKIEELLQAKRRMGLPDARLGRRTPVMEMPAAGAELDLMVEEELGRLEGHG
ncbi:MAG: class II aldolase/adducin family protein [Terracidiphilus sp.]|nr:class II aldolase/adducin family protein [Terracidiphilus sp.]